jgi:hypothetical protein
MICFATCLLVVRVLIPTFTGVFTIHMGPYFLSKVLISSAGVLKLRLGFWGSYIITYIVFRSLCWLDIFLSVALASTFVRK